MEGVQLPYEMIYLRFLSLSLHSCVSTRHLIGCTLFYFAAMQKNILYVADVEPYYEAAEAPAAV